MNSITLQGNAILKGSWAPPGDKSISHRAIMFGALSDGESIYSNFLEAEDCLHTLWAFQALGVPIELQKGKGKVKIQGVGLHGLKASAKELYLGNSGTSMRLLLGILAGQRFETVLSGDPSLSARPMQRVTKPLKQMGAQIKGRDNGNFAPLAIRGGKLKGIDFENKLLSAQVKSAILLAGLYAEGPTRIWEPITSRDHTEKFLAAAGVSLRQKDHWLEITKTERLKPISAEISGDMSAAAFFIVGAAMTPGSHLKINQVCLNPTRIGLINILQRMGAIINISQTDSDLEPMGTIEVRGGQLKGTRIAKDEIPALIDELPIIMTAMALARGESLISGAEELRVKETDRIHSMVTNLTAIGGKLQELPDGCIIQGIDGFHGGQVESFGDHRTAMSLAIATLRMRGELKIQDIDCVSTSLPTFFDVFQRLKT